MAWYSDLPHDQAGGDGGVRSITQFVCIHATDNTASAVAEAHYAESRSDGTSAHFYSDETIAIQALDTDHIAYGCYPIGNSRSVQFEICGLSNQLTDASLRKVAPVVARVCQEYGLPIRKISSADLVAGVKGICGHRDVTYAWNQGDHTDPGSSFPWSTFIGYVQAALNPPAIDEEDDMPSFQTGQLKEGFFEDVLAPDGSVAVAKRKFVTELAVPPCNGGALPWGAGWISFGCDFTAGGEQVSLDVSYHDGIGWSVKNLVITAASARKGFALPDNAGKVSVMRKRQSATDTSDTVPVSWLLEYGKR